MTTYARMVNNKAVDVTTHHPNELHHPEVAALFVVVPDGTQDHASQDPVTLMWSAPVPVEHVPAFLPLDPLDFYLAFKVAERIAIKASTDAVVREFWETYERCEAAKKPIDPNTVEAQAALAYMVSLGILAASSRVNEIRAGVMQ